MQLGERHLYGLLWLVLACFVACGLALEGPSLALDRLLRLQYHLARLLTDFTVVGGTGAALLNAALVAAIGLILVWRSDVRLAGPTIAAVFTMLGFGLFGKTPSNAIPIIVGAAISARLVGKRFQEYILMALFGTALGPLVSGLAFELGLPFAAAIPTAIVGGVAAGILLPPVAIAMLRTHQGLNLYNIGMTCGFIGLFAASVPVASGAAPSAAPIWNMAPGLPLTLLIPVVCTLMLTLAFAAGPRLALKEMLTIMKQPGRLPTDFVTIASGAGALLNAAVLGLLLWSYVLIVGAPLNGPVLGGILTAIGFATFGKHPRNCWPVSCTL